MYFRAISCSPVLSPVIVPHLNSKHQTDFLTDSALKLFQLSCFQTHLLCSYAANCIH